MHGKVEYLAVLSRFSKNEERICIIQMANQLTPETSYLENINNQVNTYIQEKDTKIEV